MTELSNLCGLAQVRAVKKSCHVALVFSHCAISKEYLYGYAADGYRSPLWLCAAFEGSPTLVYARSGFRLSFHYGVQARQLVVLSGIDYFDAHRMHPSLAAQLDMPMERRSQAVATEERHEAASASATDTEDSTSDAASIAASDPADPTVSWCPPIPDAVDDPTEQKIASAADQLDILISQPKSEDNPFCHPANLGVLPHLWLQARLQFTLPAIQEKFSRILVSVAGELWLRGEGATIEAVLPRVARALTVRLAEKLAQALSTLMRLAESMVTPETECLLYATYWFRPILSELLHTAGESAALNKNRAPSGPVKVLVTDRQPKRVQNVVVYAAVRPPSLYGFPPAGRVKLHLSSWRTPLRMGKSRKFRNLRALSELVSMTAKSNINSRRSDFQPEICLSLILPLTRRSEMVASLQSSSKVTPKIS